MEVSFFLHKALFGTLQKLCLKVPFGSIGERYQSVSDILKELEQDLHDEERMAMIRKYAPLGLMLTTVGLLGFGVYLWKLDTQKGAYEEEMSRYESAKKKLFESPQDAVFDLERLYNTAISKGVRLLALWQLRGVFKILTSENAKNLEETEQKLEKLDLRNKAFDRLLELTKLLQLISVKEKGQEEMVQKKFLELKGSLMNAGNPWEDIFFNLYVLWTAQQKNLQNFKELVEKAEKEQKREILMTVRGLQKTVFKDSEHE